MLGRTIICGVVWWCMAPMWASHVQDSLVVDGIRFDYVSDVNIDSLLVDKPVPQEPLEWWLGVGWEVHASAVNPTLSWLTSSLGSNRPNVFLERRLHRGQTGHTWALRVDHHQPWTLKEDQVSPFVKGWIAGESVAGPRPCVKWCLFLTAWRSNGTHWKRLWSRATRFAWAWSGRGPTQEGHGGHVSRWLLMCFVLRCGACSFHKTPLNGQGCLPKMCFKG